MIFGTEKTDILPIIAQSKEIATYTCHASERDAMTAQTEIDQLLRNAATVSLIP